MEMGMVMPAWLQGLMGETYFEGCEVHSNKEKNIFCLHCCITICPHCLPSHHSHSLLQVRRYVYHDVVQLDDLEKLIDCSMIQSYTINSAKVVFLKQRPQTRSCKGRANLCSTCERILQEEFNFCCLYCKVHFMRGQDLTSIILHNADHFSFSELMVISDEEDQVRSCQPEEEATEEKKKKKKKKKKKGSFLMLSLGSRRKSAPHRAPFS